MKTLVLIPSRMASKRFPDKPMAIIKGKPMIQRVWEQAVKSNLGDVKVVCCEKIVYDCISSLGGEAIITDPDLPTGTDRIYEGIKNHNNIDEYDSIINLQGDMPLIDSSDIGKVNLPLLQGFDIGTLVTDLKTAEVKNTNITKAKINWIKKNKIGKAIDFYRVSKNESEDYHHVGIYSFRFQTLKKFITLPPSKNEIERKLEQMRALDAEMTIGVNYVKNVPISIDTKEDLNNVEKIMSDEKN